ncbi:SGNH/GDSL hydrolase family protein [Polynucleobacter necessarius]|uniref:SGNH/GDSL hydrolase family protein n=1 Tax=Polynucleobacter necessarius TaxID=576610 RepID=UPI002F93806D
MGLDFLSKNIAIARITLTLFCLLISFGTHSQPKPAILVMGDSLSAEYGLARGAGWVRLLEDELKKQGSTWIVFNASISGETSAGDLTRLQKLLDQKTWHCSIKAWC